MVTKKTVKTEIWWIDDDFLPTAPAGNTAAARIINRSKKAHVTGIPPFEFEELLQSGRLVTPDMFWVDFKLNEFRSQDGVRYPFTGEALVGKILDYFKHEERPIYLVSKVLDDESSKIDDEFFELKIPRKNLTIEHTRELLIRDALDYRAIRSIKNRRSVDSIFDLLAAPDCTREQLKEALPEQFQKGLGSPPRKGKSSRPSERHGNVILFARWIRRILFKYPGLLYDDIYAATYLGMTPKAFDKRIGNLSKQNKAIARAEYNGVFARQSNRRWWKQALADAVYEAAAKKKIVFSNAWEVATNLFEIKKSDRSRCVVCGKEFPETVAFDPSEPSVKRPVHRHCSLIANRPSPKGFEQFWMLPQ